MLETLLEASINGMGGDAKVSFQKGWLNCASESKLFHHLKRGRTL